MKTTKRMELWFQRNPTKSRKGYRWARYDILVKEGETAPFHSLYFQGDHDPKAHDLYVTIQWKE